MAGGNLLDSTVLKHKSDYIASLFNPQMAFHHNHHKIQITGHGKSAVWQLMGRDSPSEPRPSASLPPGSPSS